MNALKDIKKQAEVIVDDLASREINRIEGNSIAFETNSKYLFHYL